MLYGSTSSARFDLQVKEWTKKTAGPKSSGNSLNSFELIT